MSSDQRDHATMTPDLPSAPDPQLGPTSDDLPSDLAIRVRDLAKRYDVDASPRDRLLRTVLRSRAAPVREFWALRDVGFELRRGESLGIVGRNGSGKSTLMQILAGTVTPTTGCAWVRGRVAALLELAAGFNPEFTGRENVMLKGAILGLTRRQMLDRFDDIAAFADIGEFIDRPVKCYSSGMRARLGFAVSVCVDPDVLILDEILSVGDMGFRHKCVSRMRRLQDSGVTLLLVSHSPDAVKSMCGLGLLLDRGHVVHFGSAEDTVNRYVASFKSPPAPDHPVPEHKLPSVEPGESFAPGTLRYGTGEAKIVAARLLDRSGKPSKFFSLGDPVTLEIEVLASDRVARPDIGFVVRDRTGVDLFGTHASRERAACRALEPGQHARAAFTFENPLGKGSYSVSMRVIALSDSPGSGRRVLDNVDAGLTFRVMADPDRRVRHKMHVPVSASTQAPIEPHPIGASPPRTGDEQHCSDEPRR